MKNSSLVDTQDGKRHYAFVRFFKKRNLINMLLVNLLSCADQFGKKLTQNLYGFFLKTIFYSYS